VTLATQPQLLAGLRVFDLSIVTAGAGCTQVLGDYGADVIKIESADRPDLFRDWTPTEAGDGGDLYCGPFRTINRNKRGFGVDLKHPDGLDVARRLIAKCDVVVENFRQGVMNRLGLGFDRLVEIRPDIVMVSVSSQGTTGPNVGYGSYGSTLDALGGTMSVTGYDENTPLWSSNKINYPDQTASLLGPALIVFGILAARASGQPQWIDMSQRELVTSLLSEQILLRSLGGTDPVPTANCGPVGFEWVTQCSGEDEWLAISVFTDSDRRVVGEVVGRADTAMTTDSDLRDAVVEWSRQRTKFEAMDMLQSAGVAAAAVMKGYELLTDPYYTSIDYFQSVDLPNGGSELQRGPIVRFDADEAAPRVHRRAPHVGEHTVEIMTELLGTPPAEIERLLAAGAISKPAR
jgi:crotonobetainyl-CoA:carnitine CoA-transferase CaiB-like acyl-CoA transferase